MHSYEKKIRVVIVGATGYTGADLIRLLYRHPYVEIVALATHSYAGEKIHDVFGHFYGLDLPDLVSIEDTCFEKCDVVFSALPHGVSHDLIRKLPRHIKIIDLSADFRLNNISQYEKWYNVSHTAKEFMTETAYGLSEHFADNIKNARIIACPGCYPTAALLSLLPLVKEQCIYTDDIIIDAKSGVSGAGRSLKKNTLFCETGEGIQPYSVGKHRHMIEIEEKLSLYSQNDIRISFTPHIIPMCRGELVTSYVKLQKNMHINDLRDVLMQAYDDSSFIRIYEHNHTPYTHNVRGSNYCDIAVFNDNIKERAIIISVIDNLVKGSSGQAIQNLNIMYNIPQDCGLEQLPLFP